MDTTQTSPTEAPAPPANPVTFRGITHTQLPDESLQLQLNPKTALVLRMDQDGNLRRAAQAWVTLEVGKLQIAQVGGSSANYMVQAAGHLAMNQALGFRIDLPDLVDELPNPAVGRDTFGCITSVRACVEVIGPDLRGDVVRIRQKFEYVCHHYIVIRMLAKAKDRTGYGGEIIKALEGFSFVNTSEINKIDKAKHLVFPLDPQVAMCIEFGTPAFHSYCSESVAVRKNAIDCAITKATRKAFERHPGDSLATLPKAKVQNGAINVPLTVWLRPNDDRPIKTVEHTDTSDSVDGVEPEDVLPDEDGQLTILGEKE